MINNATFLLVINFSIGLSFAAAFLALSWSSGLSLGRWFAAGFVSASATVMVEAFAFAIPSVRLVSALSFGFLMLALTLVAVGLVAHYRPKTSIRWLAIFAIGAVILNPLVVFDLPRGGLAQALAYQLPFAVVSAIAAAIVFANSRRALDLALSAVLSVCALQFVAKGLAPLIGNGQAPGVREYVSSVYAYYSQTLATILAILLGLALVGLVVAEIVAESARRVERDPLSGALTRSAFLDQAAEILRHVALQPRSAGLIICDLDHFKSVNDRFGHAAGDEVIRTFGELLRDTTGSDGVCGRIGGEEFCMLLTNRSTAAVRTEVEALRIKMARASYPLIPSEVGVTASFGIAMTDALESLSDAMRRADLALYDAKAAGRNGYSFALSVTRSEVKA